MELTGERHLPIDRARAWSALNDPDVLCATIPGCESMERTSENHYAILIAAALGPVRARFRGRLAVEDIVAPERYTLRFEGDGGVAGFARGTARVGLAADGAGTRLEYVVSSQVGGRLAQVGNRLIDAAARKLADDFFTAFEKRVTPAPTAPAAVAAAEPPPLPWVARVLPPLAMIAVLAAIVWLTHRGSS